MHDLSDNLSKLLHQCILPHMPAVALQEEDAHRRHRLYTEDMDNLYAAHLETLQALYSRYRLPPRAGGKRVRQMDLDGWMAGAYTRQFFGSR